MPPHPVSFPVAQEAVAPLHLLPVLNVAGQLFALPLAHPQAPLLAIAGRKDLTRLVLLEHIPAVQHLLACRTLDRTYVFILGGKEKGGGI